MIASATKKPSSLVWKINLGDALNVFPRNGFVMVIQIALMELTRIPQCIIALLNSLVLPICSHAAMDVASAR